MFLPEYFKLKHLIVGHLLVYSAVIDPVEIIDQIKCFKLLELNP